MIQKFFKTSGVFITVPFTSHKKALGKNGKLEKHEHSSAHIISIEMENIKNNAIKKTDLYSNRSTK